MFIINIVFLQIIYFVWIGTYFLGLIHDEISIFGWKFGLRNKPHKKNIHLKSLDSISNFERLLSCVWKSTILEFKHFIINTTFLDNVKYVLTKKNEFTSHYLTMARMTQNNCECYKLFKKLPHINLFNFNRYKIFNIV